MKLVVLDMLTDIVSEDYWDKFNRFGNVIKYDNTSVEELEDRIRDVDAIITNKIQLGKNEIDMAKNLKYIGVVATGYDIIDIDYAKDRSIAVTNVPSYGTDTVAEFTMGLILSLAHRFEFHSDKVKEGMWEEKKNFSFKLTPQIELAGKSIGIIGYGKIGKRLAEIAKAFKMKTYVLDRKGRYRIEDDVEFTSLDNLLEKSDIVTLHSKLTEENRGMANLDFFKKMKESAFFINVSRGGLVNEQDLAFALDNNYIYGAAIDTSVKEPIESNNPLLGCKDLIITPHMAWLTNEAIERIIDISVKNLEGFINNKNINRVI